MQNSVNIDFSELTNDFSHYLAMIKTIEKSSSLCNEASTTCFNLRVKFAVLAAQEIGVRRNFFNNSEILENHSSSHHPVEIIEELCSLAEIMEIGLDIESFEEGSDHEQLYLSYQGAFSLLHQEINRLKAVYSKCNLKAA